MTYYGCFEEFFVDHVDAFTRQLAHEPLRDELGESLLRQSLLHLGCRTLIAEFRARYDPDLADPGDDDLYRAFVQDLRDPGVRAEIASTYPELDRLLRLRVDQTAELVNLCVARLEADGPQLTELGLHPGELQSIELSGGDSHNGGRRVLLVHGSKSSLAYKPRPIDVDALLNRIVEGLDTPDGPLRLAPVRQLARAEYGWQELVAARPCETPEQVRRCFRSAGQWLGLFHALGATDLHFENVIADGEDLRFIDLETAIGHISHEAAEGDVNHHTVLNRSVLGTMLLPGAMANSVFDVSIAGLNTGLSEQSLTRTSFDIGGLGTNAISFRTVPLQVAGHASVVRLGDEPQMPMDFADEIDAGYTEATAHLADHRTMLVDLIRDHPRTVVRKVLRPTAVYGRFLDASLHPRYLTGRAARRDLLGLLGGSPSTEQGVGHFPAVHEAEIEAIAELDIPYFAVELGSCALVGNQSRTIDDYFLRPPGDSLLDRLAATATDVVFNRSIIHQSMAATARGEHRQITGSRFLLTDLTVDGPSERADRITRYLLDIACQDDTDPGYWITPQILAEDTWVLDRALPTLMDAGGMAAFLTESDSAEAVELGEGYAARHADTALAAAVGRHDLSIFAGVGSQLLLTAHHDPARLAELAHRADVVEVADARATRVDLGGTDADFTHGLSGFGFALSTVLAEGEREPWREVAARARDAVGRAWLTGRYDGNGELAHGTAGMMLGIVAWSGLADDLDHPLATTALDGLGALAHGAGRPDRDGWCRGQHGALAASVLAHRLAHVPNDENHDIHAEWVADLWGRAPVATGAVDDISLCHGLAGEIDSWLTIDQALGLDLAPRIADRLESRVASLGRSGYTGGIPYSAGMPTYLMGLAGFGHVARRVTSGGPSLIMPATRQEAAVA